MNRTQEIRNKTILRLKPEFHQCVTVEKLHYSPGHVVGFQFHGRGVSAVIDDSVSITSEMMRDITSELVTNWSRLYFMEDDNDV